MTFCLLPDQQRKKSPKKWPFNFNFKPPATLLARPKPSKRSPGRRRPIFEKPFLPSTAPKRRGEPGPQPTQLIPSKRKFKKNKKFAFDTEVFLNNRGKKLNKRWPAKPAPPRLPPPSPEPPLYRPEPPQQPYIPQPSREPVYRPEPPRPTPTQLFRPDPPPPPRREQFTPETSRERFKPEPTRRKYFPDRSPPRDPFNDRPINRRKKPLVNPDFNFQDDNRIDVDFDRPSRPFKNERRKRPVLEEKPKFIPTPRPKPPSRDTIKPPKRKFRKKKKVPSRYQPLPTGTTPRPIPLPGVDFPFHIPPKNPIVTPPPEEDDYVYNYEYKYDPANYEDYDYDTNEIAEKKDESNGFMDDTHSPFFESKKISKRRGKRDTARSAASPSPSLFWHNGRPRRGPNRMRSNNQRGRRRRQHGYNDRIYQQDDYRFSQTFWDDIDDSPQGFFSEPEPTEPPYVPQRYNSYRRGSSNRYRDPYPQQSIQSYPENEYDRASYDPYEERHNAVLGSGNFEVLKGGTFYDNDVYYHSEQNRRPRPNQNSGDNILYNFRDFADIKNDLYQYK